MAIALHTFISDPLGLGGNSGHFPNALEWSAPYAFKGGGAGASSSDQFIGYEWADSVTLTRRGPDDYRGFCCTIRFVPSSQGSADPLTVSVNPIDHFAWSATAMGSNGRCYAILVYADRKNPDYGGTRYAVLPPRFPCAARFATRARVKGIVAPD